MKYIRYRAEHEAELAFVMRKRAFRIDRAQALDPVRGCTCANDVTARDIQFTGGNYLNVVWSKAYPAICPIGPWLVGGGINRQAYESGRGRTLEEN